MRTAVPRSLTLLLLAALVAACGGAGGSVAASVNGEAIQRDLLERMVHAQLDTQGVEAQSLEPEQRRERVAPVQQQMLTALIQFELVEQLAGEFDVEVDEGDVEEAFDQQVEQFGGEESYRDQTGLTEEEFRDLLVTTQVRVDALVASLTEDVTEEDLREAYETQRESRFETRAVRHILVETEQEALDVIERLEDGEDFGELAAELSQDPGSAPQGGEYGHQPRGQYVEAFDEAVWNAEVGELVGPVETEHGFHVLEVTEENVESFEEARDELEQDLTSGEAQESFNSLIEGAFADADIDVDPAFGRWDPSSGSVTDAEPFAPAPSQGQDGQREIPEELREQFPDGEVPEELLEQYEEFERQMEQQGGAGQP